MAVKHAGKDTITYRIALLCELTIIPIECYQLLHSIGIMVNSHKSTMHLHIQEVIWTLNNLSTIFAMHSPSNGVMILKCSPHAAESVPLKCKNSEAVVAKVGSCLLSARSYPFPPHGIIFWEDHIISKAHSHQTDSYNIILHPATFDMS